MAGGHHDVIPDQKTRAECSDGLVPEPLAGADTVSGGQCWGDQARGAVAIAADRRCIDESNRARGIARVEAGQSLHLLTVVGAIDDVRHDVGSLHDSIVAQSRTCQCSEQPSAKEISSASHRSSFKQRRLRELDHMLHSAGPPPRAADQVLGQAVRQIDPPLAQGQVGTAGRNLGLGEAQGPPSQDTTRRCTGSAASGDGHCSVFHHSDLGRPSPRAARGASAGDGSAPRQWQLTPLGHHTHPLWGS